MKKLKKLKYYMGFVFVGVVAAMTSIGAVLTHTYKANAYEDISNRTNISATVSETVPEATDPIVLEDADIMLLSNNKDFGGARALFVETIELEESWSEWAPNGDSRYNFGLKVTSSKFTAGLYKFESSYFVIKNGVVDNWGTELQVLFKKKGTNSDIIPYDYDQITNLEGVTLEEGFVYLDKDFDLIIYSTDDHDQPWMQFWCDKYDIKDVKAPVIGGTVNLSVNVDSQPSESEIISHVTAHDETDGYVPVEVTSSNYVQGEMKVGTYTINIKASDKAGNTSTGTITVYRFDGTAPTITCSQTEYAVNYDNTLSLEGIKSTIQVHDNVDSNCTLSVEYDNFTGNEHKVGNYSIQFRAKDASNNQSTVCTVSIAVKNLGTPVITGPKTITLGTTEKLSLETFKSKYSVVDGYDGTIEDYTITGFDEYTSTSRKVGTNRITIEATNSGGNKATFYVDIVKEDTIAPGIFYESYFILLKQGEQFTLDMIMDQAALVLNVDIAQIESVSGEFDTNVVGDYEISVLMFNGETENFILSVYGDEEKKETSNDFDFNKFFSFQGYTENFFNYPNWTNWNIWIWGTYILAGIILGLVIYFKVIKRKKSTGKKRR